MITHINGTSPTGSFCVWCGGPTPDGQRWCSARCHAEEDGGVPGDFYGKDDEDDMLDGNSDE